MSTIAGYSYRESISPPFRTSTHSYWISTPLKINSSAFASSIVGFHTSEWSVRLHWKAIDGITLAYNSPNQSQYSKFFFGVNIFKLSYHSRPIVYESSFSCKVAPLPTFSKGKEFKDHSRYSAFLFTTHGTTCYVPPYKKWLKFSFLHLIAL